MELNPYKSKFFSMIIFKIILLCIILNRTNQLSFKFPKTLTLLDNSLLVIGDNGIHFFNENLSEEDISLNISIYS